MIPSEVAALKEILMKFATNSEMQAIRWAYRIVEGMEASGWEIHKTALADDGGRNG